MYAATSQAGSPEEPEEGKKRKKQGWDWQTVISLIVALTGVATGITGYAINRNSITDARQSQDSDRWGTAVNQLSSTLQYVQIGGVGGLEALSQQSQYSEYTARTLDVLSAFVQHQSPSVSDCSTKPVSQPVHVALEAIAKLDTTVELGSEADLSQTCLYPVRLPGVNLVGVTLADAADPGQGANLYRADLCGADLAYAQASGGTHFVQANLTGANLTGADFHGADLRGAILDHAIVKGANFRGAKFDHASSLRGIDPQDADFTGAIGLSFSGSAPSDPPPC